MTPGRHHLEVRLDGHDPLAEGIDIAAGQSLANVALAAAAAVTTVTLFVLVESHGTAGSNRLRPARTTSAGVQLAGRF